MRETRGVREGEDAEGLEGSPAGAVACVGVGVGCTGRREPRALGKPRSRAFAGRAPVLRLGQACDFFWSCALKVKVSFKVIRSFTLDVLSSDTIGSIKGKLCRIEGASIDQQELFFEGNHLDDTKTLSDYNFSPDSSIDVHVDGRMQISIKIPSMEKTFTLNVKYMTTVQKLKVIIQDAVGIPLDQQLLVFCGNLLKDDQVLISCGDMNDSIIYFLLNPLAEILLYVHVSSGDTFSLEVMAGCTIRDVMIIVKSLKGIPTNQLKNFHDNVELQDNFSLLSYKIMHKSVLQLQVPMQIFVKTATRKTITHG